MVAEVTGDGKLENGLVILGTFKAITKNPAIEAKFHKELMNMKLLCTHINISLEEMRRKPVRP